jgi:hypothetical protein
MTIIRSAVGAALFFAVILGMRWGADAIVKKAIRESKDSKYSWNSSDLGIKTSPAFDWQDPKYQLKPNWQDSMLYRPNNTDNDSGPKYRIR